MSIYRTNADLMARLGKLEAVLGAAAAFLYALKSDPGYPSRREEALWDAVRAAQAPVVERECLHLTTEFESHRCVVCGEEGPHESVMAIRRRNAGLAPVVGEELDEEDG